MRFFIAVVMFGAVVTSGAIAADAPAVKTSPEPVVSPDLIWANLMEGNKRFMTGKTQQRNVVQLREQLSTGQKPRVIVLTCADSRLSPELIFDQSLGDLFVVRIAGNIADKIALGSMEYSVEHLHSSLIVILGHEKCGAVAAAASGAKMESPNLAELVGRIAPALEKLKTKATGDELALLQVQANVNQSAVDVLKNSAVIREALEQSKVTIVKAVYRLKSGEVVRLPAKE